MKIIYKAFFLITVLCFVTSRRTKQDSVDIESTNGKGNWQIFAKRDAELNPEDEPVYYLKVQIQ